MAFFTQWNSPRFWWIAVGSTAVSMGAFLTFALPLTWLAWRNPKRLAKYRIQARGPKKPAREIVGQSLWVWLKNNLWLSALVVLGWPVLRLSGLHLGPMPPAYLIALKLVGIIYLDDFIYYWMHRAMHWGPLFRHIHKIHHQIRTPWAITGHNMHPLEFVLTGSIALIGPCLLSCHVATLWVWVCFRQWEAAEGHCGYAFPWSPTAFLPGSDGALHHDYHHYRVHGNYSGFLAYLDGWFGTLSKGYKEHLKSRQGAQ